MAHFLLTDGSRRAVGTCVVAAGVLLAASLPADAAGQSVAIENATVIDVSTLASGSGPRVVTASIVVIDGVITAIGPEAEVPADAVVVDGRGKFVVPGLWDMHAHLAALTPIGRAPERYVGHGVLNVRDMGSFPDSVFPLRAAVLRGDRVGPELVLAGPTLNGIEPAPFHRLVATEAEARAVVVELSARGADFIKVHRAMEPSVFRALLEEAERIGLPVAGHVPLGMTWIEASEAGMRTFEHVQTMFENVRSDAGSSAAQFMEVAARLEGALGDSIFDAMRRHGTFFDPTLVGYETSIANAEANLAALRRIAFERMKTITARAAGAGVRIVAGTDVRHGSRLLDELDLLASIGLSPAEVLAAATSNAAEAAGRPELGTLAVGTPASFLILEADPLVDVANLRTLHAVVLRGRLILAEELASLRAP